MDGAGFLINRRRAGKINQKVDMTAAGLGDRIFQPERDSRVAILYEHREITYAALRDETARVAERLNALGISEGERIAILLADSPEFIASFLAIISMGAIAVPINLALRREDQLFILKDCGARAAIIEASSIEALIGEADAPPELHDILVVRRVADSQISLVRGISVEDLESAAKKYALPDGRATAPLTDATLDADAFILYTSGSTGEPK